jgi:transcriptional regulator with XRE-family HTH domain
MEQEFTVLENKTIGRNLYKFRKIREKKATEIADHIGISEAAYTKYERGESKITIDIIQKVAEYLKVDPIQILTSQPGHIVENVHNSPFAIHGTVTATDEKQTALIMKLIETQITMNERLMALLEKK